MIIGLPPRQAPITEPLRGLCHSFYLVYTGQREAAARRRAHRLGAHFVYARREPFLICE